MEYKDISHCFNWCTRYIANVLSIERRQKQCLVILTGNPATPRSRSKPTGKGGRPPGWRVKEKAPAAHLAPDAALALAAPAVGAAPAAHLAPVSDLEAGITAG